MENIKVQRKIKLLMAGVLLLFFVSVGVEVVTAFDSARQGYRDGYESVRNRRGEEAASQKGEDAARKDGDSSDNFHVFVDVEPINRDANAEAVVNGRESAVRIDFGGVSIPVHMSGWMKAINILFGLVVLVAIIAFVVEMVRFTITFPKRKITDPSNTGAFRRVALWLVVISAVGYAVSLSHFVWANRHFVMEGYRVVFPTPPWGFAIALILLAFAEILKLTGRLQNEQELTI